MVHQQQRFCSYTFVPENDNRRLLRCARCKDTYYKDQESQRAHWKVHKKVCKPLDVAERNRIFAFDASEVAVALSQTLVAIFTDVQDAVGRSFLYLLQRLEDLCQEAAKGEKKGVGGGILDPEISSTHMLEDPSAIKEGEHNRGVVLTQLIELIGMGNKTIELLWAIPGMTNYILGHSLISEAMQKKQASGILPSRAENNGHYYNADYHIHPVFCNMMGIFITVSGMKEVGAHDQADFRRGTPLAAAAARRAMTWWSNPYSRASIPRRRLCRCTPRTIWFQVVFFGLLESPRADWEQEGADIANGIELVPGLTAKDVCLLLMQEEALHNSPASFHRLSDLFAQNIVRCPTAWQAFSAADRALVTRALYKFSTDNRNDIPQENRLCSMRLCDIVTGYTTDTCLWLKVIKVICEHPDDDAVSFFRAWLVHILAKVKPTVLCFLELAKEMDPNTPNIPDDAIRSICEFALSTDRSYVAYEAV
jgi:MYND finger